MARDIALVLIFGCALAAILSLWYTDKAMAAIVTIGIMGAIALKRMRK